MGEIARRLVVLMALAPAAVASAGDRVSIGVPAESDAGCVARTMRIPTDGRADQLPDVAAVEFTVGADGSVMGIATDGARPLLATQLRRAVTMCGWNAAADVRGVPKAMRVRMPIRFELHERSGVLAQLEFARATVVAAR